MGERRKLKDILETISVVFGSCLAAIIIIVVHYKISSAIFGALLYILFFLCEVQ